MSGRASRIVSNSTTSLVRFVIAVGATLYLIPFVIEHIGKDDYGLWSLAFSLAGFLSLLDLGFATSVVKYVAELRGRQDVERRDAIVGTLMAVYLAMGLLVALVTVLCVPQLSDWFAIPAAQHEQATALFYLVSFRLALFLPLSLIKGVLFGEQHISAINLVQAVAALLNLALVVVLLEMGHGVVAMGVVSLALMVLEHVVYWVLLRGLVPDVRLRLSAFRWGLLREVAAFALFAALVNVSAVVLLQTDPIIVKAFLPLGAVAVYGVVMNVAKYVLMFVKQIANAITPAVAEMGGAGDDEAVRRVLLTGTKYAVGLAIPLAAGLSVYGADLLLLWVGPDLVEGAPILTVLLAATVFMTARESAGSVLAMTGHHRFAALMAVISALFNLFVSVALGFTLGMLGIALGTLAAGALVDAGFVVPKACRVYGISLWTYLRRAVLPLVAPTIASLGAAFGLRAAHVPTSLPELAAHLAGVGVVFVIAFAACATSREERRVITSRLPGRR